MRQEFYKWGEDATLRTFKSEDGERFTEVRFGIIAATISVDQWWRTLDCASYEGLMESVNSHHHWLAVLPWMDVDSEIKQRFFDQFSDAEATEERRAAMCGVNVKNHEREVDLVKQSLEFHRAYIAGEAISSHTTWLALEFSKLIVAKDVKAIRRIITIMKIKNERYELLSERGGDGSAKGEMIRKFCWLIRKKRSLPTKKQLRLACHLSDLTQEKFAAKTMKCLGLFGLPTEREI